MAGAFIEIAADSPEVSQGLRDLIQRLANPEPVFRNIGEHLKNSHRARWNAQIDPSGKPWEPLAKSTLAQKRKNRDKILVEEGRLRNSLHYALNPDGVSFGTNSIYAAIQHFGGTIHHAARSQQAYFKQGADGAVGPKFVTKSKSNFAQWVTLAAHDTVIPARPFLGLSAEDEAEIPALIGKYLAG